jgi:ribosome-associated heat shock protein Hsp15
MQPDHDASGRVRIDKWLWAARFFKTRSIAAEAIGGGKVELNGERPKPAKLLGVGDEVRIRLGPYDHVVIVQKTSEQRGPASVAQTLYAETEQSKTERQKLAEQLRIAPARFVYEDRGRPTKKNRRDLSRFIDRERGGRGGEE